MNGKKKTIKIFFYCTSLQVIILYIFFSPLCSGNRVFYLSVTSSPAQSLPTTTWLLSHHTIKTAVPLITNDFLLLRNG